MKDEQRLPAVLLDTMQRKFVKEAVTEVCPYRDYLMHALNARTNHVHAVVSAAVKPEKIVNDFKVYSTRRLRNEGQFTSDQKIWSRGASTRYLWKPRHVLAAVDYVLYCIVRKIFLSNLRIDDWGCLVPIELNVTPLLMRGLPHRDWLMLLGDARKV